MPSRMDQHHFALRAEESVTNPATGHEGALIAVECKDFDCIPDCVARHQQVEIVELTPAEIGIERVSEDRTLERDRRYAAGVERRKNSEQFSREEEVVGPDCIALTTERLELSPRQMWNEVSQEPRAHSVTSGKFEDPVPVQWQSREAFNARASRI